MLSVVGRTLLLWPDPWIMDRPQGWTACEELRPDHLHRLLLHPRTKADHRVGSYIKGLGELAEAVDYDDDGVITNEELSKHITANSVVDSESDALKNNITALFRQIDCDN